MDFWNDSLQKSLFRLNNVFLFIFHIYIFIKKHVYKIVNLLETESD